MLKKYVTGPYIMNTYILLTGVSAQCINMARDGLYGLYIFFCSSCSYSIILHFDKVGDRLHPWSYLFIILYKVTMSNICPLVDHLSYTNNLIISVLNGQTQQGISGVASYLIHLTIIAGILQRVWPFSLYLWH